MKALMILKVQMPFFFHRILNAPKIRGECLHLFLLWHLSCHKCLDSFKSTEFLRIESISVPLNRTTFTLETLDLHYQKYILFIAYHSFF